MQQTIDWKSLVVCCFAISAASAAGNGILTAKDYWKDRTDAPQTALSNLGVAGFMSHARVANWDSRLENRLAQVKLTMKFSNIPENVVLQKEAIPATLAEAADYLNSNVCMAYPPVLCVETDEAFFFSGGRSATPVHDFSSGMAIMKEDGSIWSWDQVEVEQEKQRGETPSFH